ncbi:hypothetical protein CDAR_76481 [Caerostris darwini]|uniref:Uncharacterized protein n=1 Tax=Caerostris darwini TaxID=1538125 RepID=A0AAV4QCI0_9ARAC|nr:hypothetical protein CDAR_76481 [Caerostris darwini]
MISPSAFLDEFKCRRVSFRTKESFHNIGTIPVSIPEACNPEMMKRELSLLLSDNLQVKREEKESSNSRFISKEKIRRRREGKIRRRQSTLLTPFPPYLSEKESFPP